MCQGRVLWLSAQAGKEGNRVERGDDYAAPRAGWRRVDLAVAFGAAEGRLFLWLPVLLATGIAGYFALRFEPEPWLYASALGAALVLVWLAWRLGDGARLAALGALILAIGFSLAGWRAHQVGAPVLGWRYYGPIEGRVVRIDRSARDRIRLTLDQPVLRDLSPARTPERVRVALGGADWPKGIVPGTRIMTTGHLGPPSGPSSPEGYDFRRHAWFERLGALGYTRNPVLIVAPPARGDGLMIGHRARMRVSRAIQDQIGGQPGAVAAALMTGDRSGIAEATNESLRASNLYHIVAISGLHMGMLAGFVLGALRLFLAVSGLALRWPAHKLAAMGALIAAGIYLWLAGGSVATTRAFVMVAVMLGAVLADRRAISLQSLALAALAILLIWPETITQPGFQMSFAATAALILSWRPWQRVQGHIPRLVRPVAMLVVSSAIAGFATAPIAAAHFNRMADYGVLANLLSVSVMGVVVMPAGVIAGVLAPLGLAGPVLWVMGQGVAWILGVARWIAGLDGAWHAVAAPPAAVLPLLSLGAVLMIIPAQRWRWSGLPLVVLGAGLWWLSPRPDLLIAAEGELVGIMTPAGRALSKPKGGAYTAQSWLLEDGDTADQPTAAARAGFEGPANNRHITTPDGMRLVHLTGTSSASNLAEACTAADLVVSNKALSMPPNAPCRLLDLNSLRDTGAISARHGATGWVFVTTARKVGARLWAPGVSGARRDQ